MLGHQTHAALICYKKRAIGGQQFIVSCLATAIFKSPIFQEAINPIKAMKTLILLLAITAFAAAGPVPAGEDSDEGSDIPAHRLQMLLDLEEVDLEFFPNGTIKQGSMSDLLRLYYSKKDVDDYTGNKTQEHYEEEEDDDDENDENGGNRSKRTVFDDDERLPIPNSNLNSGLPYCALAEVSNGCTAIFIGPNHALTAGRCVYDRTNRRFRTGLRLYRRRNCVQYGSSMSTTNLFTVNGYALSGLAEYDYGLIVTSQRSACWASFGYRDPWNNRGFDLLGYPTDKRSKSGCFYHSAYFSSCTYSSTARNGLYLQHRCDTSGMIGAPLISEVVDQVGVTRGQRAVFGVNVYTGSFYNYGPRINRDRFYQIVDWMRQTGYNPTLAN